MSDTVLAMRERRDGVDRRYLFATGALSDGSFGLRASRHHWPTSATMPTNACE